MPISTDNYKTQESIEHENAGMFTPASCDAISASALPLLHGLWCSLAGQACPPRPRSLLHLLCSPTLTNPAVSVTHTHTITLPRSHAQTQATPNVLTHSHLLIRALTGLHSSTHGAHDLHTLTQYTLVTLTHSH